jgi:bifunctional non-homologous end joining protein LigD
VRIEDQGTELFRVAKEKKMEGIIAKRKDSIYRPGKRTSDWLKIKPRLQQEFVVGGFTEGKGGRKHLGALLLGAYRNGMLHYNGHSGSGFSEKGLKDALDRMKPLFTDKSPFENPPQVPEKIQWVKPKLVCEAAFAEWTQDGELRQTTSLGWRDDKIPRQWLRDHQPPLLVLWGRYDTSFTVAGGEAYHRDDPRAEVHILDAGHFALDLKPKEIIRLTEAFLGKQPRQR